MKDSPNVALIQDLYAAYVRGDTQFILGSLADQVSWLYHGESVVPWAGSYRGREDVARFFATLSSAVEVELFEPQEFVAQGDRVISIGVFGARVKSTGKRLRSKWIFAWTIRDGMVVDYEQWHDEGMAAGFRQ